MDEIELKYTLDEAGHKILQERFKASMKMVVDAGNFIFMLGDGNMLRLREERFKGSKTYFLTYKQGKSRSKKVMLRVEEEAKISEEAYTALMGLLPEPTSAYETTRHMWDGYDSEKYQLDKFLFTDGKFFLYEMEIEFEDIKKRADIEQKAETLFQSLGINYSKGTLSKYDRYSMAQTLEE